MQPPYERVLDLCAGVGVVGLGLLEREPAARATLIELQERLAALAARNAHDNGMAARARVHRGDLVHPLPDDAATGYDVAVANPPYRRLADGPASPVAEVAIAQHELSMTLAELVQRMAEALAPGGRAALVYPAARVGELLATLDAAGLKPGRLRCVHPRADEPANRVLVEGRKGAKSPLVVEAPLVLRDAAGYTAEAARILGEPA